jgi:molybdopterin biosynthesis enzyme
VFAEPLQPQTADVIECVEAAAPGKKVEMRGSVVAAVALLAAAGIALTPIDVAILISAGSATVKVVQQRSL